MSSRIVGLLLVLGVASLCQGLSVSPCSSNGTIAVEENSKDFVFTCGSDLDMQHPTTWTFQDRPPDPQQVISVCSRSPSSSSYPWSCASNYSVMIIGSINEHTRRSHVILPDVIRGRFPDGTWRCKNGGSFAECSIDVVHTPSDVQCQVTVDEAQGMVHGTCQTSQMFSSHGNYFCQWFENNGNKAETEIPQTDTEFNLTDCTEGETMEYFCGNCSFNKLLPFVSESYGYRVVISPGSISPSIGYSIVKAKANSLSSTQEGLPVSVPRMTSTQSATSSRTMTSLRPGLTLKQSSPNPPTVEVNEEVVNSARYEGIGIGVAACIALLILVALLVCVALKCRRKSRKESEDGPGNSISNHIYDPADFPHNHVGNCENNRHRPNTAVVSNGVPSQTSSRSFDSQPDGGYTSIASPFDTASYLVPFANASGSDVAAGGSHDDKACRDHTYMSRISMDLPPTRYETMHAPLSTQSKVKPSSQHTKSEEKMEEEEEENLENEKAEAAEASFLASGFQMKDAEYIHINNTAIPLSDLV
ncbi:uncharacterized protein [Littorina saxatilis]|uniref:Ig-like domain-containing protein n=1 Tax=Littorina saxatilis TaxID=31220 RepID=A0AAN9BJ34_9CAEN